MPDPTSPVELSPTPPLPAGARPAPPAEVSRPAGPPPGPGVSWRAILIGLLLIPVNTYWITVVEVRWYTLDGTSLPLFIQPVFFLFLLCLANLALLRWRPRSAMRQGELLTIYVLVALSCVFASHDLLQNLFGVIGHPFRFATAENHWPERFLQLVPRWLFVTDRDALIGFYNGDVSPWDWRVLKHWVVPLAWWTSFVLALVVNALCFNILLRRQWTENERLAFPLVQLPVAMTSEGVRHPFWKSRIMWAGFATAASITLFNGLHFLYPSIPYLEFIKQYDIAQGWPRPWGAVGSMPISLYPFAIGIAYFIPLDLSFSCWFFYLWRKAQQILGEIYGWNAAENHGWPFFSEQSSGAWIGLALMILWTLRGHFGRVIEAAMGVGPAHGSRGNSCGIDDAELQRYRWAIAGIVASVAFLIWFMLQMQASLGIAALFVAIYIGLSLAITRIRAELGTPHEINFVSPQAILVNTLGTSSLGRPNLTAISSLYWFNRGYRSHPMPNQLEAFKMAEGGRMEVNRLIVVMLAASLIAILVTYWANLQVTYDAGATAKAAGFKSWVGRESFDRLSNWIANPVSVQMKNLYFMMGGLLFVFFLKSMRNAFVWWPFHPAGYALAMSYAMDYFWFAFMASWLIKLILVRYGGMRTHSSAAPFFLGLVLGDYVAGSFWAILGPALHLTTYKIFI
jgi:hypothetical protein